MKWSLLLFILLISYQKPLENEGQKILHHRGFPPIVYPEDNQPNEKKIALGKKLFHDPILSLQGDISCATCHQEKLAFTDGLALSIGHQGAVNKRNAPTLFNVAWHPYFFREGGNPKLESQILGPLEAEDEMAHPIPLAMERLRQNDEYQKLFKDAFGREPDLYEAARAIAAYERTLIHDYSRWDQWYYLGKNTLSDQEKKGWELFTGKAMCISCHKGPDLSHYKMENIGLFIDYKDMGLYRITRDSADYGKIKTPTLRNISITAPYMHNGSFNTLEEVIEHYNKGGVGHPAQNPIIKPIHLSQEEKEALLALLKSF